MKKQEIVTLVIRISSLALIFYTLNRASYTIRSWNRFSESDLTANLIMVLAPLLLAIFAWFAAFHLANVFLPTINEDNEATEWNQEKVEATAFTVIGVFVLTYAIPDTFYWLSVVYQSIKLNANTSGEPQYFARAITLAIKLIMGFWLLFGAKGLREFLTKVRVAGQKKGF